jgi:hypothetical protein
MEIFFHDELLREVFQTVAPFIKASNHQSDDRKVNRGPKKKRNTKQSIKKNKENRKQRKEQTPDEKNKIFKKEVEALLEISKMIA